MRHKSGRQLPIPSWQQFMAENCGWLVGHPRPRVSTSRDSQLDPDPDFVFIFIVYHFLAQKVLLDYLKPMKTIHPTQSQPIHLHIAVKPKMSKFRFFSILQVPQHQEMDFFFLLTFWDSNNLGIVEDEELQKTANIWSKRFCLKDEV